MPGIGEVLAYAKSGDMAAVEAFRQAGMLLGIGLANIVNLFDPARIILSGEGVPAAQFILEPMQQFLQNRTFSQLSLPVLTLQHAAKTA